MIVNEEYNQGLTRLPVILNEVKDLLAYMLEYEILRSAQND